MPGENHIIRVPYSASGRTRTRSVYQYDYGQILSLDGFPEGMLPETFEMHFSTEGGWSVTVLGRDGQAGVPDACLRKWQTVKAWLFLHDTESDGETRYAVEIPVRPRAQVPVHGPAPVLQDAVTAAVAALNTAVVRTGESRDAAEAARDEAAVSASEAAAAAGEAAAAAGEAAAAAARSEASAASLLASAAGVVDPGWESGSLYDATGIEYAASSACRSGFIPAVPGERLMLVCDGPELSPPNFTLQEFADNTVTAAGVNVRLLTCSDTVRQWFRVSSGSARYIRISFGKPLSAVAGRVYLIRESGANAALNGRVDSVLRAVSPVIPSAYVKELVFSRYGVSRQDGTVTSSDTRIHSAFVCVRKGDVVSVPEGYKFAAFRFTPESGYASCSYDEENRWQTGEYVFTADGFVSVVLEKMSGAVFTSGECRALDGKCLIYSDNVQTVGGMPFEPGHIDTADAPSLWSPGGQDYRYNTWGNRTLYTTRYRTRKPWPVGRGTTVSAAKGWRFYIFRFDGGSFAATRWYTGSYTFGEDAVVRLVLDRTSGTTVFSAWPALDEILTIRGAVEKSASEYNADMDQAVAWASGYNAYAGGDSAAASGRKRNFTFTLITDVHGSGEAFRRFIDYSNEHAPYLDAVLCCGDMVPVEPSQSIPWFAENLSRSAVPFLFTPGNHDVGQTNLSGISQEAARENYFSAITGKGWLSASDFIGNGKCSWYKDFPDYGIRVVAPFEYGNCYETASGATNKCARRWWDSAGLQWIADTLYSTPAGYSVMILLHQTSSANMTFVENDPFCITKEGSYASAHWNDLFMNLIDGNPLEDLVNAFRTGADFSRTYGCQAWTQLTMQASVSKNFSARGEPGRFVAYFCGHTHANCIFRSAAYPDQLCIGFPTGSENLYQRKYGDIPYTPDTRGRDSFCLAGIDTEAGKINLVKLGGQLTDDMRERKITSIRYE